MPPRFRSALVVAALTHGAFVVRFAARGHVAASVTPRDQAPIIELETTLVSSAPNAIGAGEAPEAAPPRPAAPVARGPARTTVEETPLAASAASGAWTFSPLRVAAVDLAMHGAGAGDVDAARAEANAATTRENPAARALRDGVAARDTEIGLGRGGVLVAALHEVAASAAAPEVGRTNVDVIWDAVGNVVEARTDNVAWDDVARALVARMKGIFVRVAHPSHGGRARLLVVAERAPPSGARGTTSLGAVPDDVAGGATRACVGTGLGRKCVSGMPLGLTASQHDTSNLGARSARVVHVQLLDENEIHTR